MSESRPKLIDIYHILHRHFGHRSWWPGETPLEIIVGAILTQNTAWVNVEKAIRNLKVNKALSVRRLREVDEKQLAEWLRPSGYFNQKAKKIKAFIAYLEQSHRGSISSMKQAPSEQLREELLKINGIGPETADSILLYALGKEIFVVDAYTRRIFRRHEYFTKDPSYSETQEFFEGELPRDAALYNDFHAQIVATGNRYCKPIPRCKGCPLEHLPHRKD